MKIKQVKVQKAKRVRMIHKSGWKFNQWRLIMCVCLLVVYFL